MQTLTVPVNQIKIRGDLRCPKNSTLLVIIVLGERNERYYNQFIQLRDILNECTIATFFVPELLTQDEKRIAANRFDESLLADRLIQITSQLRSLPETRELQFSYLGLSNVADRIFRAVSILKGEIESLVLIGDGLPPLNMVFSEISVLNILGELDFKSIESNQIFLNQIHTPLKRLYLIPGTHSHFDEPQKWKLVSKTALRWFNSPENRNLEFAE
ncbi:hypothetical protein [Leptospira noguchii]|uniref:Dienelactone hydrolase n=1 Tax=Leptospira noguchii TaxID=28182 RepID=M6VSB0_9LEPT|nr:hypothetical protein [Leptospira noguchii]EMO52478.1 hypothetical protein LEP1GSC172_0161 [Leptospira noguchii]